MSNIQDGVSSVIGHLKTADEIATVFGVSRKTVIKWVKKGAPICIIGRKYQARYEDLWHWLLEQQDLMKHSYTPVVKPQSSIVAKL